jgi:hypothetical protein
VRRRLVWRRKPTAGTFRESCLRVADDFAARYAGLLAGSYDCVDRIVLNAYYSMGNTAGAPTTESVDPSPAERAVGSLAGSRHRLLGKQAGAALLGASAATRWGIFHAGLASVHDPKYTVIPQRQRRRNPPCKPDMTVNRQNGWQLPSRAQERARTVRLTPRFRSGYARPADRTAVILNTPGTSPARSATNTLRIAGDRSCIRATPIWFS